MGFKKKKKDQECDPFKATLDIGVGKLSAEDVSKIRESHLTQESLTDVTIISDRGAGRRNVIHIPRARDVDMATMFDNSQYTAYKDGQRIIHSLVFTIYPLGIEGGGYYTQRIEDVPGYWQYGVFFPHMEEPVSTMGMDEKTARELAKLYNDTKREWEVPAAVARRDIHSLTAGDWEEV